MEKLYHIGRSEEKNEIYIPDTTVSVSHAQVLVDENSDIIISGIGLDGGTQFYKSDRQVDKDHSPRAGVDKYLINVLKKNYKKRIITLDEKMAKDAQIRLWEGKIIA